MSKPLYTCWIKSNKDPAEIVNKNLLLSLFKGIVEPFDIDGLARYTFGIVYSNRLETPFYAATLNIDLIGKKITSLLPLVLETGDKKSILDLILVTSKSFEHVETLVGYFEADSLEDFDKKMTILRLMREKEFRK